MKLEAENISFSYPGNKVLKGISFSADSGEFISLAGRNGTGKSTLLKCFCGVLKTYTGKVLIENSDISLMDSRHLAAAVAYLPQKQFYPFPVSVFDVVLSGRYPYRGWFMKKKNEEAAASAIESLDLENLAMKDFNTLSGGQQQRALIARTLAQEAGVLLLDEPVSGLDIGHQLDVMHLLRKLSEENGITVICAIHDLNLASRFSDRITLIDKGVLAACGKPGEILASGTIGRTYGIDCEIYHHKENRLIFPKKSL
ncbi:MAG: ABC transporter ATP-binding protein [Fibrobacterota bacterium]